jgi:hypothetical protein
MAVRPDQVNMSDESNEFPELQRLMALKRHEQPPPGYFDRFPLRVMARIEALELKEESTGWRSFFKLLTSPSGILGFNALALTGLGLVCVSFFHVITSRPDDDQVVWVPTPSPRIAAWGAGRWPSSGLAAGTASRSFTSTNDSSGAAGLFDPPTLTQERASFVVPAH